MSLFVLDASYTLTWCFPDRATPNTDAALHRMEARNDSAIVPWVWHLEMANALGKAVSRNKVPLPRALEIWEELLLLPIRQVAVGNVPELLNLAVKHNLSVYDTCYLHSR
uniref:PIN domain-containing protein n=1 Tax=Solibacter usitatus (strain Ellin6076) TaxID=234267 RepID=Q01P36_SOLUE